MKKFIKRMFWFSIVSFAAYKGWKFYEKVRAVIRIGNSLPLFLKNTVGDKPTLYQNMAINRLEIKLKFNPETLEKEPNLEQMIREYIEDFYPMLAKMDIHIVLEPRAESEVTSMQPASSEASEAAESTEVAAPQA